MRTQKLLLHKLTVRLARHYARRRDQHGITANRILDGIPPTPETVDAWLRDVRDLMALAWDEDHVPISVQAAALSLHDELARSDARGFMERMLQERRVA